MYFNYFQIQKIYCSAPGHKNTLHPFSFDYGVLSLWCCFDDLMQCHNIYLHPDLQSFWTAGESNSTAVSNINSCFFLNTDVYLTVSASVFEMMSFALGSEETTIHSFRNMENLFHGYFTTRNNNRIKSAMANTNAVV